MSRKRQVIDLDDTKEKKRSSSSSVIVQVPGLLPEVDYEDIDPDSNNDSLFNSVTNESSIQGVLESARRQLALDEQEQYDNNNPHMDPDNFLSEPFANLSLGEGKEQKQYGPIGSHTDNPSELMPGESNDGNLDDAIMDHLADALTRQYIDEKDPDRIISKAKLAECVSNTNPNGWDELYDELEVYYEEKKKSETHMAKIRLKTELADIELLENRPNEGLFRERSIRNCIAGMGLVLAPHQKRFHEICIAALRPIIYGKDYHRSHDIIAKLTGGKIPKRWILCQTPRRFGKTVMVALLAASLVANCPGLKLGIFATNQTTATALMELALAFLYTIPGANARIFIKNRKQVALRAAGDRTNDPKLTSRIYAYPATAKGTRGFTVDCILIDEFAFIDDKVWKETIVPALSTQYMVLIGITTAQDQSNFFTKLMKIKDPESKTGEPLFEQFIVKIACDKCQERGIPEKCTHSKDRPPSWKPGAEQRRVEALYGSENKALYQQEILGLIVDKEGYIYPRADITALEKRLPYEITSAPQYVYSYVDPHGGGYTSSQAIVDIVLDGHNVVVIL